MTREEVVAILGETATDEQVQKIMDLHGIGINGVKKLSADETKRLQTLELEIPKYKQMEEDYNKLKTSTMSDEEKIKSLQEEAQKKLDEAEALKDMYTVSANRLVAEKVLLEAGVGLEENAELISAIVSEDADRTKLLAENLAKTISTKREQDEKQAKKDGMNETKIPSSGGKKPDKGDVEVPDFVKKITERTSAPTKNVLEGFN